MEVNLQNVKHAILTIERVVYFLVAAALFASGGTSSCIADCGFVVERIIFAFVDFWDAIARVGVNLNLGAALGVVFAETIQREACMLLRLLSGARGRREQHSCGISNIRDSLLARRLGWSRKHSFGHSRSK